jgi:hypothetical protein
MPLYDFKCKNTECKHSFESQLSLAHLDEFRSGNLQVICPLCRGIEVKKDHTGGARVIHSSFASWRVLDND